MKKKPTKPKTGRPEIEIDESQVRSLAAIGCTIEEIAVVTKSSRTTVKRRFGPVIKEGHAMMRSSLKRWQYQAAKDGNITMMIWLGKQYMGQKDRREDNITTDKPIILGFNHGETEVDDGDEASAALDE